MKERQVNIFSIEAISFSFRGRGGDKERLLNYEQQGKCDRLKDSHKNRG